MRTILSFISVLVAGGMVLAADSTSTATPASGKAVSPAASTAAPAAAPAVAPVAAPATPAATAPATAEPVKEKAAAPEPAPAPAPVPVEKPAPAVCAAKPACCPQLLTWSGLAMLRLRDEVITNFPNTGAYAGKELESAAFSYQIAYHLGVKVAPNDQTLIQFDIGNDWYATEEAAGIPGNFWTKRNTMTPWFDLAYAQWNPGYLHIQAGIIPVKGTPLMDLLGVSLLYNRSYNNAAHVPWGVVTNFSQTGLRLGAPIVKGPVSVGIDAMSAIIEQRPVYVAGVDSMKLNASAVEFELEVPVTVAGLTATPQALITPFRSFNKATGKSDIEFGAGVNFGYKVCNNASLRAGFGYARNSNRNTYATNNYIYDTYINPDNMNKQPVNVDSLCDSVEFDRWGTNLNVGTTVKLGPGNFDFDFNLSNQQNAYNKNVDDWYPFFDIKYGWALSKNFIVMPRVRLFFTEPKVGYNNELKTRPELIILGTF